MQSINQLNKELDSIYSKLKAGLKFRYLFEIHAYPIGEGSKYLEIHDNEYHIVWSERGDEIKRFTTKCSTEILFQYTSLAIKNIVLSTSYDNTRPEIARRLDLMRIINTEWAEREKTEFIRLFPDEIDDCI